MKVANQLTTRSVRAALAATVLAVPLLASSTAFAADKKAERAYKANCASCHGAEGKADTEKGQKMKMADISTAEWQAKFTDAQISDAITKGVHETRGGVKKDMDAFPADKISDELRTGVVAYVRGLKK